MPPKGKSSGSSHSSRSRSSSSSRSSRSYSSRSSSSSSGSRSYSSGSSHSSRSVSTAPRSSYRQSGVFSGSSTRQYRYPDRSAGRYSGVPVTTLLLHDALHDYTYVPYDYTDADGVRKQSGYYDENGTYYQKGSLNSQTLELKCPYCDTKNKITWTEGPLPKCPVCGGTYDVPIQNVKRTYSDDVPSEAKPKKRGIRFVAVIFVIIAVLAGVYSFVAKPPETTEKAGYQTVHEDRTPSDQDIYVEEIGRTCSWDSENEWWVDRKSGCYFYFDETVAPSQWKYWYDGIGDDYGDYGWMEYDDEEGQWYIEVSEKQWEVLPDRYDMKGVWHMNDAFQGPRAKTD